MTKKNMGIGIVFLLAAVFLVIGIVLFIYYGVKINGYVKTQATIVDYEAQGFREEDIKYAPIVRYFTPKGFFTATGPYRKNVQIGDKVDIAYNPEEPSHCIFIKHTMTAPIFMTVMGGAFLVFGIVFALLCKRAKNPNSHIEIHGLDI